jgi:hypothetical protein
MQISRLANEAERHHHTFLITGETTFMCPCETEINFVQPHRDGTVIKSKQYV